MRVIPRIAPYRMPAATELPASTVEWQPDRDRAVLLIHDMQRYFVRFLPTGRQPTTDLLANIDRARRAAAALGIPVVYTAQPGAMTRAQRGLLHDVWGPGMTADPDDRSIVAELAPGSADVVIRKHRYSAFHRTDLASRLAAMERNQLVVCGVFAHIGCLLTACDAFSHDHETFLVADAVADFTRREHLMALDYAARICAVPVTTDRLLAELTARPASGTVADPGANGREPTPRARPATRSRTV